MRHSWILASMLCTAAACGNNTPPTPMPNSVTIRFSGTGAGNVHYTSGHTDGLCEGPSACQFMPDDGVDIMLTAVPAVGSHFVDWEGCITPSETATDLLLPALTGSHQQDTCTAKFDADPTAAPRDPIGVLFADSCQSTRDAATGDFACAAADTAAGQILLLSADEVGQLIPIDDHCVGIADAGAVFSVDGGPIDVTSSLQTFTATFDPAGQLYDFTPAPGAMFAPPDELDLTTEAGNVAIPIDPGPVDVLDFNGVPEYEPAPRLDRVLIEIVGPEGANSVGVVQCDYPVANPTAPDPMPILSPAVLQYMQANQMHASGVDLASVDEVVVQSWASVDRVVRAGSMIELSAQDLRDAGLTIP